MVFLIVFLPVIGGIFFKRLFNLFSLKIIKILPKLSELTISLIKKISEKKKERFIKNIIIDV